MFERHQPPDGAIRPSRRDAEGVTDTGQTGLGTLSGSGVPRARPGGAPCEPCGSGAPSARARPARAGSRRRDRRAACPPLARAAGTFAPLVGLVVRGVAAGVLRDTDPAEIATALWATVHGAVSLELAGLLPDGGEERFTAAARAAVRGWAPPGALLT